MIIDLQVDSHNLIKYFSIDLYILLSCLLNQEDKLIDPSFSKESLNSSKQKFNIKNFSKEIK